MNYRHTCEECNREIALEYNEDDATPICCPFCSAELGEAEGDFVATPHDEFDDDDGFENF